MELLIIRTEPGYIRVKGDAYLTCQMDKASVFPRDQLSMVKDHVAKLDKQGFKAVTIRRLIITEQPFQENEDL